jgi:hypothetical protein
MTDEHSAQSVGVIRVSGSPSELPAVVDPEAMAWRSDQAVVAVVSAVAYRNRLELTIHGRTRALPLNTPDMVTMIGRGIGGQGEPEGLRLGVLGAVLDGGGIRAETHAFTASAWCQLPEDDLVVFAEWPALGIAYQERSIPAERIRRAAERVTDPW